MESVTGISVEDIKTAFGKLLLAADQNRLAKTVLDAFDPFATRSSKVKSLSKFKLELLEPCAEFLNVTLADADLNKLYTKSSLVIRIIIAIEALLPATCQQCSENYCIELKQTDIQSPENPPPFVCHMCYQGSHNCDAITRCKEALESITMISGHTWLCSDCYSSSIPVSHRKSRSRHVSISEPPSRAASNSPAPPTLPRNQNINHTDLTQRLDSVARSRVCDKYISGKCPHGLRGKKELNGEICSYEHPKKCFKYCGFGSGRKGCNNGENCHYFHPTLCKYSVQKRVCYNENCTYVHLKGTSRSKKPSEDQGEQTSRSNSNRREELKPPKAKVNKGDKSQSSEAFLELKELVEQMRTSFVSEISSIKASLSHPVHHYHPPAQLNPVSPHFLPMGHPGQKLNYYNPQTFIPQSSFSTSSL